MATTTITRLKFGTGPYDEVHIYAGTTNPEGVVAAPFGSVMYYTVGTNSTVFIKKSDKSLSTGWVDTMRPATTIVSGIVKQCALISNSSASDIAGVNSKINEILTALKSANLMSTI